jgi:hypothetical protein
MDEHTQPKAHPQNTRARWKKSSRLALRLAVWEREKGAGLGLRPHMWDYNVQVWDGMEPCSVQDGDGDASLLDGMAMSIAWREPAGSGKGRGRRLLIEIPLGTVSVSVLIPRTYIPSWPYHLFDIPPSSTVPILTKSPTRLLVKIHTLILGVDLTGMAYPSPSCPSSISQEFPRS